MAQEFSMASATFEDLYQVLGLRGGEEGLKTSAREIEQAYKKKAREIHPDKNPGDPQATSKFQRLQSAFEVLKVDATRRAHDARLRAELDRRKKSGLSSDEFEKPRREAETNGEKTANMEEFDRPVDKFEEFMKRRREFDERMKRARERAEAVRFSCLRRFSAAAYARQTESP